MDVAVRKWDLHFDDVHFRYQMRPLNRVLAGLSFEVHDGSVCALVGKSGGGKSTLIHLMLRFYDPTDGKITLGGVDLKLLNLESVHRKIGVVSLDTQLFNTTIAENSQYGIEGEVDMEEVEAACKAAQAYSFITEFEDGLMTRVGERGQRSQAVKSSGLRSRAAYYEAKAPAARRGDVRIGRGERAAVQKALDEMIWTGAQTESGGYTVPFVAHRLSTVVNSDQIVVIDKGACVEKASTTRCSQRRACMRGWSRTSCRSKRRTWRRVRTGRGGGQEWRSEEWWKWWRRICARWCATRREGGGGGREEAAEVACLFVNGTRTKALTRSHIHFSPLQPQLHAPSPILIVFF